MSSEDSAGSGPAAEKNPVDQLIELLVYAPVGLIYEYPEVLPKLISRGRSQVQLAKVLSQMAAKQSGRESTPTDVAQTLGNVVVTKAASEFWQLVAKGVTEVGKNVGLAPEAAAAPQPAPEPAPQPEPEPEPVEFPIADYDNTNARTIIGLLTDLSFADLDVVRSHEAANRNRKTVLAKIESLRPASAESDDV